VSNPEKIVRILLAKVLLLFKKKKKKKLEKYFKIIFRGYKVIWLIFLHVL